MDTQALDTPVVPFEFTGKASEYFGIWIVNVTLTLLTLGIYSAWAKVRRLRYFYGNTYLAGASFDYLASPVTILKGRIVAVAILALYLAVDNFYPLLSPLFGLAFLIALPWLVVRARLFTARNSAYRNIRFNFRPNYREAIKVFVGLALLLPLTLGAMYPYLIYRRKRFLVDNSEYGRAAFTFEGTPSSFYAVYLKAAALLLLCIIVPAAMLTTLFAQPQGVLEALQPTNLSEEAVRQAALTVFAISLALIALAFLIVAAYLTTALTNLVWNHTEIDGNRFHSELRAPYMAWLYLSNTIAIVGSLGLLIPWAAIRLARYRTQKLRLRERSLDSFVASKQQQLSASGEEIGEMFDLSIGI